ncbi:hypothetical protein RRG53_00345 [Mycoplasmopsis cynos]|uniref:Mbov_0399 family ICE element protein n=1 Tax=Mycoplasmopsis cynos TaxID=171284 RepID=UPI002AFF7C50|nr:hypothetical protein [Mycoplasmopsis cynos]WQQ18512.1 hypothetical protein RRG53_00345 [Mycoplasmopsis cynos]
MKWKVNKKIFIGLSSPILVLPFLNVSATRTYNTKYSTSHNEETWDYWKISSYDVLDNEGNINKFDEDFQVYIPGVDPLYDLGFLENFSYTRNYDNKIIFNSPDIDKVYWPQEYTQIWKNQIFNLGDSLYTLHDDDNIRFILPNGDFSKYWDNPDLSKINIINNSEIWNDPLSDFKISYDSFPGIDQKNINNTYHKIYNKTTIDLTKLNENDGFIVKRKDKNYSYNYSVNSIYVFNKEKFINNFLKNNYSYSSNPLKNFGDDNNLEIKYIKDGIIAKRSQEYGFIKNIYWNENEDTSKIYVDDDANQIYITVRDGQEKFNISKISGYSDIQNQMYEIPYSTSNGLHGVVYTNSVLNFNSKADKYFNENIPFSDVDKESNFKVKQLEILGNVSDRDFAGSKNSHTTASHVKISTTETTETNVTFNKFYGIPTKNFMFLIGLLANFNWSYHDTRIFKDWIKDDEIVLKSDSGKDSSLDDSIDKDVFKNAKTNKEKLDELIQSKAFKINFNNLEISFKYFYNIDFNDRKNINLSVKIDDIKYDGISLFDRLKTGVDFDLYLNKFDFFEDVHSSYSKNAPFIILSMIKNYLSDNGVLLNSNIKIKTENSDLYNKISTNLNIQQKLQLNPTWVINKDFSLYTLKENNNKFNEPLVLDKLQKIKEYDINKKTPAKFIANAPVTLKYVADLDETEVVFVNKKRVDVLNRVFTYNLVDNRSNIDDNERVKYNPNDNSKPDLENSHQKNEYLIEVKKYKKGTNNTVEENSYKVVLVINSFDLNQKVKFYAWDPENNKDQKDLITPYIYTEKGIKYDKNHQPIKNPKYDPSIDPDTGTKKEVVYIDNSLFKDEVLKKIRFLYPKLSENFRYGVIAEASVLGKGALRNLFSNDSNYVENYFVIKLIAKQDKKYHYLKNPEIVQIDPSKGQSANSYLSNEGIYAIIANSQNNISNIQLILIDEDNKPTSYFLDEIKNKNIQINVDETDTKVNLGNFIDYFWDIEKNKLANSFITFLIENKDISRQNAIRLDYDNLRRYYLEYINNNLFYTRNYNNILNYNIFGNYNGWNKLSLNGLVSQQKDLIIEKIKNFVIREVDRYTNTNRIRPLIYDKDYQITEFNDARAIEKLVNEAGKVQIGNIDSPNDVLTKQIHIRGLGKYANTNAAIKYDNYAYQVIYPPIDIRDIFTGIKFENNINISKNDIRKSLKLEKGVNELKVDEIYTLKIKDEVLKVINDYLKEYNKTANNKITLGKDIEIQNIDEVVTRLKNSNNDVYLKLIGKNANILGYKEIIYKNLGKNDYFNLNDLTKLFLSKKKVLNENKLFYLKQQVTNFINDTAKEINLKEYENYLIFGNNTFIYWLDLLLDLDNTEIHNETLKAKINEAKQWLKNNIDVTKEPFKLDTETKEELKKHKEAILESIIDKNLKNVIFYKNFIILPIKGKSFNYAYGGIANYYSREDDPGFNESGLPLDKGKKNRPKTNKPNIKGKGDTQQPGTRDLNKNNPNGKNNINNNSNIDNKGINDLLDKDIKKRIKNKSITLLKDRPKIDEKDLENTLNNDINQKKNKKPITNKINKPKDEEIAKRTKKIVGYSFLGLGILGALTSLVFVAKLVARKWGWKLGIKLPKFMNKTKIK